ncbi:MAG: 5-formyltetrahydrofolate cyclo-ligase [Candidatus Erginobacter occultus]|nr:5-formyltetrahydrofolate cyclo-ligase [Candidatus Erginobacter occultus]
MKAELRRRGRSAREALSREEVREKSRRIARRFLARPEYRTAASVFCYLDHGHEVETSEIIAAALREGKRVAVPLVETGGEGIRAVAIRDLEKDLAPGFRGIREPVDRSGTGVDPRELDLAVVPGTAFDLSGNRLGRGGGHYDKFLPRFRDGAARIGLAFECQIMERIVGETHDVKMDAVITEDRVVVPGESCF